MLLSQRLCNLKLHQLKRILFVRQVSTSKPKQETAIVADEKKTSETLAKISNNWISYGFDTKDEKFDRTMLHMTMFGSITLGLIVVIYGYMYAPDITLKHWAQREAFLELRRREANGLKLIDPNLIDPSQIILPSDEELCETEVII
ncbi:hypothetical protein RI129_006776 [Pyrocoelia pectoralis]|uniref:NADH dehydrogenase [ubiquinone] 1 beta subcomplex subunit 11, mitochondrial n=1 Tax=Pyrocoelia pectoralis TaxID=417401 RepID=A0AAN7VGZ1_9COLE